MGDIITIGDYSLGKKSQYDGTSKICRHLHLEFDENGHIVLCLDCNQQVEPFFALTMLADEYRKAFQRLEDDRKRFEAEKEESITSAAAKKVDKVWRSRTMTPLCPHCKEAILPEDGLGSSQTGLEYARKRREAAAIKPAASSGTIPNPPQTTAP